MVGDFPSPGCLSQLEQERLACVKSLGAISRAKGDPTPLEFEAFLTALRGFQPLPLDCTPEQLLQDPTPLDQWLPQITSPDLQQQVYRGAHAILKSKGINPQESALLAQLCDRFGLSPALAAALARQPVAHSAGLINSALGGMASLIGREGEVRRLIFDYALGGAIVGLIPLRGGGTLEIKILVILGLLLKMAWDIRNAWGRPQQRDPLAVIGNGFGFLLAVIAGLLAWASLVALGVVVPFIGAFAKAAGFATGLWVAGQSINQFYTSQKRPDVRALRRAFPDLMGEP